MAMDVPSLPPRKCLASVYVDEDKAREIFRSLAYAADELPAGRIGLSIEPVNENYGELEYIDMIDKIIEWAYQGDPWPRDVDYARFEIEDPKDPHNVIFVEIGPCRDGKCLLEVHGTRVF